MSYPTYLIHFNKNHSSKNGRFVSGDGDGDGVINDHHNQSKNRKGVTSGSESIDDMIGDQIDQMVKKYNSPTKSGTFYTAKKKDDKKKKKKSSGSRKSTKKKTTKKVTSNKIKGSSVTKIVTDNSTTPISDTPNYSSEDVEKLISENLKKQVELVEQLLGK
jgi:hypothetical protein